MTSVCCVDTRVSFKTPLPSTPAMEECDKALCPVAVKVGTWISGVVCVCNVTVGSCVLMG